MKNDRKAAFDVFWMMGIQFFLARLSVFCGAWGYILYIMSYVLPVLLYERLYPRDAMEAERRIYKKLPPMGESFRYLLAALAATVAAARVNAVFVFLLSKIGAAVKVPAPVPAGGLPGLLLTLLWMVAVPAVFEEILCRYAVLEGLLPFGNLTAAAVGGMLFGLMHANLAQILYTTVAGFLIAYFVARTHALYLGMLIHGGINAYSVFLSYAELYVPQRTFSSLYYVTEIIVFVSGIYAFYSIFKQKKGSQPGGRQAAVKTADSQALFKAPWLYIYAALTLAYGLFDLVG